MNKQVRGLGNVGLLPARPKSIVNNQSQGPSLSTANGPAPGAAPPPLAPLEPRADSVTSPPLIVSSPYVPPQLPSIAEAAAAAVAAPTAATAPPPPAPAAEAAAAAAIAPPAAASSEPLPAVGAVGGAVPGAASPVAQDSPPADQPAPGRRKPRKSRPEPDAEPEPPAKRGRGSGRRDRGRRSRRARSAEEEEAGPGPLDDGADLVGMRVEVPGSIFFVDTPGLVYVCDVQKKDDRKRAAVEVVFRDDASVYWFPVADVRRWLAEQRAREAAGTVPLVAGAEGGQDSEATEVEEVGRRGRRRRAVGEEKTGAAKAARRSRLAAAREDGSSQQEGSGGGGVLDAVEAIVARALTDISAGGSGSRGAAPVDSPPTGVVKATSRLQHAG